MNSLLNVIVDIPNGTSQGTFDSATYSISKTEFNNGKSIKIYAEELGGNNFISCNFYRTKNDFLIKPCEMPLEKVVNFLTTFKLKE